MHTSVRLYPDKFSLRFFGMNAGLAGLLLAILLVGCTKQELPDLGPRLSQTAALELSPSLLEFKGEYTDNCGHLQIVQMGSTLQDMLFEAANRTFASVVRPGSNVKPDVVVRVNAGAVEFHSPLGRRLRSRTNRPAARRSRVLRGPSGLRLG